jgi:predicted methyltransferase
MARPILSLMLALAAGVATLPTAVALAAPSPAIIAALADPARTPAEKARDDPRKAAEVAEFAGVKPGDKVADLFPGTGYFAHIFAKVVGPSGVVYAAVGNAKESTPPPADPAYPNVKVDTQAWGDFGPPEKLDVVFNSQFYHDLFNPQFDPPTGGPEGLAKVNRAIFNALKPGGVYVIIDHAGAPGTGYTQMNTLHRIEESVVKDELKQAGFVLEAESDVLRNPADPHTAMVFDPTIRGKTDQFVLRFRKPK